MDSWDHYSRALHHLELAENSERPWTREEHLRAAEIHATLNVAMEIRTKSWR